MGWDLVGTLLTLRRRAGSISKFQSASAKNPGSVLWPLGGNIWKYSDAFGLVGTFGHFWPPHLPGGSRTKTSQSLRKKNQSATPPGVGSDTPQDRTLHFWDMVMVGQAWSSNEPSPSLITEDTFLSGILVQVWASLRHLKPNFGNELLATKKVPMRECDGAKDCRKNPHQK